MIVCLLTLGEKIRYECAGGEEGISWQDARYTRNSRGLEGRWAVDSTDCIQLYLCFFCQVFSYSELEMIANLCKKYDILCISDEVYEHMIYEGNAHFRMGKLRSSVG